MIDSLPLELQSSENSSDMQRHTNQRKQSGSCLHPSGKTHAACSDLDPHSPEELRNHPTVCVGLETMASLWQHISTVLTSPLGLHGLWYISGNMQVQGNTCKTIFEFI